MIAVIPARGGSKGIPKKNIMPICDKPLLAWSILHAKNATQIESVWVTSDDLEILDVAKEYGAETIQRPSHLAGDASSSEAAWIHAIQHMKQQKINPDLIVGMQATSPIRGADDLDLAIFQFMAEELDSLLAATEVDDYFSWRIGSTNAEPIDHDFKNRKPRQEIRTKYLENGSFYIFKPENIRKNINRLSGKIGIYAMEKYKMFQIDNPADAILCEVIMRGYGLDS